MDISNETRVSTWKCFNGSVAEMDGNGTALSGEEFKGNISECFLESKASGMALSEVLTVVITIVLGLIGIVFNIGILVITFQKKLTKKDYRMLYYMFITTGDLLFAINSVFVGINIAFQSAYVFKLFGVCITFMLIFGVVAYEWSAICIILLLTDLVWTLKNPFKDNKNMKVFSKIGCVWTFFLGIVLAVGPFLYWQDIPNELPFCSIGNLYGKHLEVYQHEVVIVLSTLVAIMILVSAILLFEIYRSHTVGDSSIGPTSSDSNDSNDGGRYIRTTDSSSTQKDERCFVITVDVSTGPNSTHIGMQSGGRISNTEGEVNNAFVDDTGENIDDNKYNKSKGLTEKNKDARNENDVVDTGATNSSQRDVRRREFYRACQTVGFFMAAYLGCCMPYLIWNALGLACGKECSDNDRPETRVIRALVATALYLLPIIDPILYTRRFDVIRKASVGVLKRMCICKISQTSTE